MGHYSAHVYTLMQVIHNHPRVPHEWSGDQSHARSFAVFYEQHVKKGKFKMNAEGRVSIIHIVSIHIVYKIFVE